MGRAVALPTPRARRALALPRVAGWQLLTIVVALSATLRTAVAFARQTPMYFPDEYMYSELGRSIATSGRPLVRGTESSFPALLQPIVTAPAWLIDDVATAYHLIQAMNAAAMSLAAVPVYLLARRVGVGDRLAVVCATLALVLPDLVYAGWMLSEPFAYPLALLAAFLAVRALDRPSFGAQLGFLAAAGLASFARVQLLVLLPCFVAAVLGIGLRERALARAVRGQWLVAGVSLAAAAAFIVRGSVGIYAQLLDFDLGPARLTHRLATQSLALLYGAGWVLVPAALLGLAAGIARPRTRAELAFATFTITFTLGLLMQASLWGDSGQMQERYLFYCVPLLALGFALHAGRGWPWWRAHALICGTMLLLAALVPLSGYVVLGGKNHATVLFAVAEAQRLFGSIGAGALAFAAAAGALSLLAAFFSRTPVATGALSAFALAALVSVAVSASLYDLRYDGAVRRAYLPAERSWVDRTGLHDVALVYGYGVPNEGLEHLFWNRSVKRILLLPGAPPLDAFGAERLDIGPDGRLSAGGAPLRQPLLLDGGGAVIRLRGAARVAVSPEYALWRPAGVPRLAYYARGYYRDGWLGTAGALRVWDKRIAGRITFTLRRLADEVPATMTLRTREGVTKISIAPGETRRVTVTACGRGAWKARFSVNTSTIITGRLLGIRSTAPVWTPAPRACRAGV